MAWSWRSLISLRSQCGTGGSIHRSLRIWPLSLARPSRLCVQVPYSALLPGSCMVAVYLRWCLVVERLVRALVVVESEITRQGLASLPWIGIISEIDLLVLDRPPQPLHKDVVERPPFAVHTDLHTC